MKTSHRLITCNSMQIPVETGSVDLIVTSPPYPMVTMWDNLFKELNSNVGQRLEDGDGFGAFTEMHRVLDNVWQECDRVLSKSGIICINIGDATRTIDEQFALYPNHSYITHYFLSKGYTAMPLIIWRKVSNAPNKFMGSGMLPLGAYVTQEHEYILVFRKGQRKLSKQDIEKRRESAYFYDERNVWFSDCWSITGTTQVLRDKDLRQCSAAYPLEIPYRLINMYSIKGDTVLDPFNGTGTTMLAGMLTERNSIGVDIDPKINELVKCRIVNEFDSINQRVWDRLGLQMNRADEQGYTVLNTNHNFMVKTVQESHILLNVMDTVTWRDNEATVDYIKCFQF